MTDAELLEKGKELGLKPRKLKNDGDKEKFQKEILAKEQLLKDREAKLEDKAKKLSKRGKSLSVKDQAELDAIKGKKRQDDPDKLFPKFGGTNVPYIRLSGDLPSVADWAKVAVPVYVSNFSEFGAPSEEKTLPIVGNINAAKSALAGKDQAINNARAKFQGQSTELLDDLAISLGKNETDYSGIDRSDTIFKGLYSGRDPFIFEMGGHPDAMFDTKGTRAIRVLDVASVMMARANERKKDKADKAVSIFSDNAVSVGVRSMKAEPATPVYVVNRSVPTDAGQLLLGIAKILLKVIMPFGGDLVAGQLESLAGGNAGGVDQLLDMAGLATGGEGKALTSATKKTTHFISGDSLNKSPNPEQVSIDWNKKSYSVKPIPAFATGGGESASGQVRRMTSGERNQPMSVGISSHTITYERALQGANDSGNKEALKVYSVNPGITDLVELGNGRVSLIGLVADMTSRLASIEQLLSVGNEQTSAVVAATSATAANVSKLATKSSSGQNPFAGGFPNDLDSILVGR